MSFSECHRLWWLWVQVSCNTSHRYDNRCLYCFLYILWDNFFFGGTFLHTRIRKGAEHNMLTHILIYCICVLCGKIIPYTHTAFVFIRKATLTHSDNINKIKTKCSTKGIRPIFLSFSRWLYNYYHCLLTILSTVCKC